jgi:hypothetical protein
METMTKKEQLIMTIKEIMVLKNISGGWFVKYILNNPKRLNMKQLNAIYNEIQGGK